MTEKEKPIGLNYRILIPQLTEEFKFKVVSNKINLSDVFIISEAGEKYAKKLIKKDVNENYALNYIQYISSPEVITKQKEKSLFKKIFNIK